MAVSGGPDSIALMLLCHACRPGQFEVATVDHGLRADSAAEAAMVAKICDQLGIRHATLPVEVSGGNLQNAARTARYAALGRWARDRDLVALATAHHGDDQAETVIMRLNRGSGISGLSGIRPMTSHPGTGIAIFRPLLNWSKDELTEIVTGAGISPATDPSNADPRFDRAQVRAALKGADWLNPLAIARSAALLHESDLALGWIAAQIWDRTIAYVDDAVEWSPQDEPRAVRLRIVARAIAEAGGTDFTMSAVARLHDAIINQDVRGGTLAGVQLSVRKGTWTFRPEPPRATVS
ncbi:tRNA lysidine(34) synthetase TilS [Altererythrobacter sp. TH136]|uniref:tRNA lysidine(34) synthetase TilS n=1 Tax=Altererythrobacter sp. TH136 TaxID=2067415 RepID=UPI0011623912|nr:tRNA lysidine(34) synthetase TilS [Altererythrobacter sp. TH136]QDM41381.1 tRNA lysidine(34) synthetase TilS [Altererythrobacter sp. TH136]